MSGKWCRVSRKIWTVDGLAEEIEMGGDGPYEWDEVDIFPLERNLRDHV